MNLEKVLPFAHSLLKKAVNEGEIAIDCTVGNGHDTLFLAHLVGATGIVYGFDIQKQAIENTFERLREHGVHEHVILYPMGHEQLSDALPREAFGKITGAIFNLGYLPGSDKTVVTKPETTILAINQLLEWMAPGGVIVVVVYHGHEEGAKEKEQLLPYVRQIDQDIAHVLQYQFINQKNNPPFVIALEKKKSYNKQ